MQSSKDDSSLTVDLGERLQDFGLDQELEIFKQLVMVEHGDKSFNISSRQQQSPGSAQAPSADINQSHVKLIVDTAATSHSSHHSKNEDGEEDGTDRSPKNVSERSKAVSFPIPFKDSYPSFKDQSAHFEFYYSEGSSNLSDFFRYSDEYDADREYSNFTGSDLTSAFSTLELIPNIK